MKRVDFTKYTVFLLVCFFSLIFTSKAAYDVEDTVNVRLPYGSTYSIDGAAYENFNCKTESLSALKYTLANKVYTISLKQVMEKEGTESLVCTYDDVTAVKDKEGKVSGKITYNITYTPGAEDTKEYSLGFGTDSRNMISELGASEIIEYSVQSKNREYIDMSKCSQNSSSCVVSLSQAGKDLNDGQNYIAIVIFKYKVSGSNAVYTMNAHFNINATGSIIIWDNWTDSRPLGFCSYSGDWKQESYTRSSGQSIYFYGTSNKDAVLPNCTVNTANVVPVQFKGWLTGVSNNNNQYLYAIGECSSVVAPGTKVSEGGNYAPCYEANNAMVRLSLSTGSVNASGWTVSTTSRYEYYHLGSNTDDTIALPDVVYSGAFAENKKLQCWENQTTKACVAPGTVVKTDGTVYVAITDTEHTEYSYFKSVRVNDAVVFAVDGMTGCSIASGQPSGYIDVSSINGDCMVMGLRETDSGTFVEVNVALSNGSNKIYKFTVDSNVGLGAAGNGEFIINPNVNTGEENAYSDSSDFKTGGCTTFTISPSNPSMKIPGGNIPGTSSRMYSNIYSVSSQCSNDNGTYYAACLDPGRLAPEGGATYEKVKDINTDSRFGKLINYLIANNYVEEFGNLGSYRRMAAHMSIRIVAIQDGMGASTGMAYAHLHKPYQDIVNDIASKNPTSAGAYSGIVHNRTNVDTSITDIVGEILANYYENGDSAQGFERTIDSTESAAYGSTGYTVTYKGTITAPKMASNVNMIAPNPSNGVSFSVDSFSQASATADGGTVYNYQVTITAANSISVVPPVTEDEKILLSYKITYDGGKTASNVFLTQPIGEAGALQRMIVFDTSSTELYIYFNIAPNDCDLPGLDYKNDCTSADNCSESKFNKALFKASGCCRYVTDENTYEYVVNNVCAAKCTTSTMSNVCDYSTKDKLAELYEIKEGSEYNGSATGEGSGYKNAIATCIVNVDRDIRNESDKSLFEKVDDNGNSISVKSYENNRYCRVNCKEDWQISMDAFGNYVGEKAVAAGSYFQIENDVFIGGKRTCYTNYIDYDKYMNDLVVISLNIVKSYNEFSNLSHSWSDVDKQTSYTDGGFSRVQTETIKEVEYEVVNSCTDADPTTPEIEPDCEPYVRVRSTKNIETYYAYGLKVNGKFLGLGDKGDGSYQSFETIPFDKQGTVSFGSLDTQTTVKANPEGTTKTYDGGIQDMSIEIDWHEAPDTDACTPAEVDGATCYAGKFEDEYIDTRTKEGKEVGPYTVGNPGEQNAFNVLKDEMLKRLEREMAGPRSGVSGGAAEIRRLIDLMYECQHFQLVNTTDDNNSNAATSRLQGRYYPRSTLPYVEINTAYDPDVTYEYAEDAFMTILLNNKENYLEAYDEKNDAYYGGTKDSFKNATNDTKEAQIKLTSSQTEKVNLARNYLQFNYYKEGSLWDPKSEIGRNYHNDSTNSGPIKTGVDTDTFGGGESGHYTTKTITVCAIYCGGDSSVITHTNSKGIESSKLVCSDDPKWDGGKCFDTIAPYLEANYIKASIENSSFYKNQGSWYENIQDVKAHGEGLAAALGNENSNNNSGYNIDSELNSGRWSPIGLMNVFPISITTPRNMYTYTYTFKDIGSHSGGDLGRIMGDENAIISNNNRTCFYEVFEELCLCCGDKINTYVYNDADENDLIKQMMAASGYRESNQDLIEENQGGTLSFATSSVNLSDIGVDTNQRPVATNWSNKAPFTYGGEYNLTTAKGEQLKNAIESQGETIYSSTKAGGGAEYSYYLTPTTLSQIREYNDAHGYELNFNNLKVYGRYSIAALDGCSSSDLDDDDVCWRPANDDEAQEKFNNEIINFQHYGSVFLEDLAKDSGIASRETLARDGNGKVCVVVDGKFDANSIKTLVKNGCRWIDYVEDLSNNSSGVKQYVYPFSENTGSQKTVSYFRLAFK